jgi:hypothetical protein
MRVGDMVGDEPMTLKRHIEQWRQWADSSEWKGFCDGWESFYPEWDQLIACAAQSMREWDINEDALADIGYCWKISEETEDLADIVRADPSGYWRVVERLAHDREPMVRWQALDVCSEFDEQGMRILEHAHKHDPDVYCRRRAYFALLRMLGYDSD